MNEFIVVAIILFCLTWYSFVSHIKAKRIEEAYEKKAEEYRKLRLLIEQKFDKGGE